MKRQYIPGLAIGVGIVAGLRPMTALALISWSQRRGWIRPGVSPFAKIVSGGSSRRMAELVISELIADKLPFTRSRLTAAPLASRVAAGAISGAVINGTVESLPVEGAVLGGIGGFAGAITGYCIRQRLNRSMPDVAVAFLEDALAVGGGIIAIRLAVAATESG
jgi:uncharacterized membrane protein